MKAGAAGSNPLDVLASASDTRDRPLNTHPGSDESPRPGRYQRAAFLRPMKL
jgi:hypothetical protein